MAAYNSFPHQFYGSDYSELCSFLTCEETSNLFNNKNNNYMSPLVNYDIKSPVSVTSFPHDQQFGANISDIGKVSPQLSEIETGFSSFGICDYQKYDQVFEPGDQECVTNGLVPNFYNNSMAAENWALQGTPVITKSDESELVKVGRYSAEEKKERILRYLKKKNHRNFNKTIKYACRKALADKRVRVRGRFTKNNEQACEEETLMMNNTSPDHMTSYEQNNLSSDYSFQMENDENCWLQAVMANLMHLPHNY